MIKSLSSLLALVVACATTFAHAQAPAPAAAAAPAAKAPVSEKTLKAKAAMCLGCHNIPGYQASFPEVHRVPMIAGQNAGYIVAALSAYKAGERKHPTMKGVADQLSEQDMKDIAGWYSSLGQDGAKPLADKPSREPSPQVAALLQKAACASCHGANFAKPVAPEYPKIAGQHADYLFVALKAYKAEGNGPVGRSNGVMGGIAKQFSNAELKALATYLGSLEGDLKTVPESRFRK